MTDVTKLDKHIEFLRGEARYLRTSQPKAQWALTKANRFDEVADALVEVRREKQMTGMSGKRIEDSGA